jgi:hypothetical protein
VNVYVDGILYRIKITYLWFQIVRGNFEVKCSHRKSLYIKNKVIHSIITVGFLLQQEHLKNFFEDSNEQVIFIDDTRVTVVGRVVGGSVEAAKR